MVTVLSTVLSAVTIIYKKKVKNTHKSLAYGQFTILMFEKQPFQWFEYAR